MFLPLSPGLGERAGPDRGPISGRADLYKPAMQDPGGAGQTQTGVIDWIGGHETLLWWLGVGSLVSLVAAVALLPPVLGRLPRDYFLSTRRHPVAAPRHPVLRAVGLVVKNTLGAVLAIAGIAMLLLPGQGLLTILAGLVLLDFPGKYRLERWLVRRRGVGRALDWLRARAGKEPFLRDA